MVVTMYMNFEFENLSQLEGFSFALCDGSRGNTYFSFEIINVCGHNDAAGDCSCTLVNASTGKHYFCDGILNFGNGVQVQTRYDEEDTDNFVVTIWDHRNEEES